MSALYRVGGADGLPFMKFTLTYDGELRPNRGLSDKWEIRKQIAPQLEELWRIAQPLVELKASPYVPLKPNHFWTETHHSVEASEQVDEPFAAFLSANPGNWVNTIDSIERGGRRFLPLIRDTLALKCFLRITFLRREPPGRVYQGGDLDNRLKTFFDALSVPKEEQVINDPTMADPIYCLLEDDALICGFSVETHRLLARANAKVHDVQLIAEVDTRVSVPRLYNQRFLGD